MISQSTAIELCIKLEVIAHLYAKELPTSTTADMKALVKKAQSELFNKKITTLSNMTVAANNLKDLLEETPTLSAQLKDIWK